VQKISSWVLLVIVSFLIVADLKHGREKRRAQPAVPGGSVTAQQGGNVLLSAMKNGRRSRAA
jgi:hypothetical protein